jgi:hypothetical protein
MSRIKVLRASGMPVEYEHAQAFQEEMRQVYDKILLREGIDSEKPMALEEEQAKRMQRLLDRVERILRKKYPVVSEWPIIGSKRKMKELVSKHGPIMIANDSETGQPIYVIYDLEL